MDDMALSFMRPAAAGDERCTGARLDSSARVVASDPSEASITSVILRL
jgi:hypothetical protein